MRSALQLLEFVILGSSAYHAIVHPRTAIIFDWAIPHDTLVFAFVHSIPIALVYMILIGIHLRDHWTVIGVTAIGIILFPIIHVMLKGGMFGGIGYGVTLAMMSLCVPALAPLAFPRRRINGAQQGEEADAG